MGFKKKTMTLESFIAVAHMYQCIWMLRFGSRSLHLIINAHSYWITTIASLVIACETIWRIYTICIVHRTSAIAISNDQMGNMKLATIWIGVIRPSADVMNKMPSGDIFVYLCAHVQIDVGVWIWAFRCTIINKFLYISFAKCEGKQELYYIILCNTLYEMEGYKLFKLDLVVD